MLFAIHLGLCLCGGLVHIEAGTQSAVEGPMSRDQTLIVVILAISVCLFLWGKWRHDLIALAALLATVVLGLVPAKDAFNGFGHPAVITVACVLILSNALQTTGAVDTLARKVIPRETGLAATIAGLAGSAAVLSGFMNNVGALALIMPLATESAARLKVPPGRVLMPVAFGSILGGMTTLIGTPPNLIVSAFRAQNGTGGFSMFDFTPVGLAVAIAGLAFIVLGGWRLVPARERRGKDDFETEPYTTEVRVSDTGKAAGMMLSDIESELSALEAQVIGLIRDERRIAAPNPYREIHSGDVLVIQADPEALSKALSGLGLQLEAHARADQEMSQKGSGAHDHESEKNGLVKSDDLALVELAVRSNAEVTGRSATDLRLRTRHGINLLAISREGRRITERLRSSRILQGDVLLVQGPLEAIQEFASQSGCIPLAERKLRIPDPNKVLVVSAIMTLAIAGAAFGLVPAAISFAGGCLASVIFGVIPARRLYDAIDWPIIVLLAALIPVAGAMSTSGTADLIANAMVQQIAGSDALVALLVVLVTTMIFSDFMNNAATAALMCPIAIGIATQLGVNSDPFLMAVAIGASCAFLTPIGHQNNTLILGPGGFRFGDYWQLGLPLEIVIVVVAMPLLLWAWPLQSM
jgi:di/tricarboxylate transporter